MNLNRLTSEPYTSQWRILFDLEMYSLIFKLVFCNECCFNVVLCFVTELFISWAWRWGSKRASEFATLGTLCFLHWLDFLVSFKLNFYRRIGSCLSSLNHNAQLSVLRVSNTRWFFIISEKTGGKTSPCFIGCKHPSIRLNILQLSMTEFSSLILWLWTLFFPIL